MLHLSVGDNRGLSVANSGVYRDTIGVVDYLFLTKGKLFSTKVISTKGDSPSAQTVILSTCISAAAPNWFHVAPCQMLL